MFGSIGGLPPGSLHPGGSPSRIGLPLGELHPKGGGLNPGGGQTTLSTTGDSQQTGGTHPTGIHSCLT